MHTVKLASAPAAAVVDGAFPVTCLEGAAAALGVDEMEVIKGVHLNKRFLPPWLSGQHVQE